MPWSPSSTEKFLQCPMKWWLDRQGAVGRVGQWSPGMAMGTAFHAGMQARLLHNDVPLDLIVESLTRDWPPDAFLDVEKAARLVLKGVMLTMVQEGEALLNDGRVLATELNLGGTPEEAARHGRYPGTADLVTEDALDLCVTDYKSHYKMDAKYADGELRQTARSWQLRQYAHFVQERYQRPVTRIRKLLVAFTPALKVWLYEHPITQQELSSWYHQAQQVWHLMDGVVDGTIEPWQNAAECERYGWAWRCSHYSECWDGEPITFEGA